MPMLDAKALRTDAKGLAFLRSVLGHVRPRRTPSWLNTAISAAKIEPPSGGKGATNSFRRDRGL